MLRCFVLVFSGYWISRGPCRVSGVPCLQSVVSAAPGMTPCFRTVLLYGRHVHADGESSVVFVWYTPSILGIWLFALLLGILQVATPDALSRVGTQRR